MQGCLTTDERLETVFEPIYSRVLFSPTALAGDEGRAVRESLLDYQELPHNIGKLMTVLSDENTDAKMVADIAECNPAVAAKLLKVVNSSYAGLRVRITNLKRAVTLLGYDNVRGLILGLSVFSTSRARLLPEELPLGELWKHSAAVGHIGRIIARKLKGIDGATLLSAGLLHDVGKLVMATAFRRRFARVLRSSEEMKGELLDMELRVFGMTHPIIGAALCHMWNLPERLWALIAAQEHPSLGPDLRTAASLKLAEFFARSYDIGYDAQWRHGFVPEEICWHLDISIKEAESLVGPEDIRGVVESVEKATEWE